MLVFSAMGIRKNMNQCWDGDDVFEAGLAARPQNPYFVWPVTNSNSNNLFIPKTVITKYLLKIPEILLLIDDLGKKWEVKITGRREGLRCSSKRWKSLCKTNNIDIGDKCICEFVHEGSGGLYMLVRVIKSHKFTIKNGVEEEEIVQVDKESTYNNDYDESDEDESKMQMEFSKTKHKLKSLSSCAPVRSEIKDNTSKGFEEDGAVQVDKESTYNNDSDECDESESKMQFSKAKQKLKSSSLCAPVRRSARKDNTFEGKTGVEEEIQKFDQGTFYSRPLEEEEAVQVDKESTYNNDYDESDDYERTSSPCSPVRQSARKDNTFEGKTGVEEEEIQKFDEGTFYSSPLGEEEAVQVDKESTYNNDYDESDSSSCAPVSKSARTDNTFEGKTGVEEDEVQKIDQDAFYSSLPEETIRKSNAQQRTIKNKDVHIRKLKGIVMHFVTEDVQRKRSRSGTSVGSPVVMTICLPEKLEMLQSYFQLVHEKNIVSISLDDDTIFGKKYTICILLEDINNFCLLEPISESCIIAYVWYLHRKMETENILDRFRFVNPSFISHMSTRTTYARACALAERLIGASTNQLVLIPCNVGNHWILTVINPYNMTVFLLDPLAHRIRDEAWKEVVDLALSMFNEAKGEKGKNLPDWRILNAPLQPDSKQCGFYIMRYMREIVENCRDLDLDPLQSLSAKDGYSQNAIDEVRVEWAEWILKNIYC